MLFPCLTRGFLSGVRNHEPFLPTPGAKRLIRQPFGRLHLAHNPELSSQYGRFRASASNRAVNDRVPVR